MLCRAEFHAGCVMVRTSGSGDAVQGCLMMTVADQRPHLPRASRGRVGFRSHNQQVMMLIFCDNGYSQLAEVMQ